MDPAPLLAWTLSLLVAAPAAAPKPAPTPTPAATPEAEAPAVEAEAPETEPADEPADDAEEAAPEPAPEPEPEPAPEGGLDAARVDALRQEARDLRDELFRARARVSDVTSKLFSSKVTVELRSNLPRFYDISDLTITLDGAPVYLRETGMDQTGEPIVELFAAPGSHELGVSASLVARRDRTYTVRFDQAFAFVVPENASVSTRVRIRETGNMWRFARRQRGSYKLRTDLKVRAKANKTKGAKAPAPRASGTVNAEAKGGTGK